MARSLLVALTWATAASAARYVDYSGVKMPQYGAGDYEAARDAGQAAALDEYHGHSPDASASLDYKYEEDIQGKTEIAPKDADEARIWRKPSRKHRELMRPPEENNPEALNTYETKPKYRSSRRFPKHRSRLKSRRSRNEEELTRGKSMEYDKEKNDINDIINSKDYFNGDKVDFLDDKSKEFEENADHFRYKDTTPRLIRRKPRDRFMKTRSEINGNLQNDDARLNLRKTRGRRIEPEYSIEEDVRGREGNERGSRYRPVIDIDELSVVAPPPEKQKPKAYDDYGDYYDMKRVHNIKSKLPSLLRRTSASTSLPSATSSSIVEDLWTVRSLAPPLSPAPPPAATAATTIISTFASTIAGNISKELSIAEKSRLSILKKAQRKESLREEASTKKPPVLMQVTNKMPIVVMVEPPASDGPWLRAREVADDTPERIERAKRLMRHKLVARARSIQDLTDNWDEVVCDYIDVSLLDGAPAAGHSGPATLLLTVLVLVIY